LFACTNAENMRDASVKGRVQHGDGHYLRRNPELIKRGDNHYARQHPELIVRGERHHNAKLKEADIVEIRRLHATGEWRLRELGVKFGVDPAHISLIVQRKRWGHVA
jgi:hypothetical protein